MFSHLQSAVGDAVKNKRSLCPEVAAKAIPAGHCTKFSFTDTAYFLFVYWMLSSFGALVTVGSLTPVFEPTIPSSTRMLAVFVLHRRCQIFVKQIFLWGSAKVTSDFRNTAVLPKGPQGPQFVFEGQVPACQNHRRTYTPVSFLPPCPYPIPLSPPPRATPHTSR